MRVVTVAVVVRDMHVRGQHVQRLRRGMAVATVTIVVMIMVVIMVVIMVMRVIHRVAAFAVEKVEIVVMIVIMIVRVIDRRVRRAGGRRRRHCTARPLGIAHDLKVVARATTVAGDVPERTARTLVGRRGLADAGRLLRPTLRAGIARGRNGRPARR